MAKAGIADDEPGEIPSEDVLKDAMGVAAEYSTLPTDVTRTARLRPGLRVDSGSGDFLHDPPQRLDVGCTVEAVGSSFDRIFRKPKARKCRAVPELPQPFCQCRYVSVGKQ